MPGESACQQAWDVRCRSRGAAGLPMSCSLGQGTHCVGEAERPMEARFLQSNAGTEHYHRTDGTHGR